MAVVPIEYGSGYCCFWRGWIIWWLRLEWIAGTEDLSVEEGVDDPAQTLHWILISTISIRSDLSFNCPQLKLWGNKKDIRQQENLERKKLLEI